MFTCPHHPEIRQAQPGKCPICAMPLVQVSNETTTRSFFMQYKPLLIIVGLIVLVSIVTSFEAGYFIPAYFMRSFMAGFFIVFSGFKLLDLQGFAKGYAKYDVIASRIFEYGYIYPFIELLLGLGYILIPTLALLHLVTAIVMLIGGIGVTHKLLKREQFTCACLGTIINVPLTYVTFVENFGMAAMAIIMLLYF